MRLPLLACLALTVAALFPSAIAQGQTEAAKGGPVSAKAQKTFADAVKTEHEHHAREALDLYRKADKQDGDRCSACAQNFWATWCGPCREALPRIRQIAQKFQGEPLVVLSISLDRDEAKWKDFVAKNGMTWPQYRDGGFDSPLSRTFGVNAIPHTFAIDADGVLRDEHVGDASIEGNLKKLLVQAKHSQNEETASAGQ